MLLQILDDGIQFGKSGIDPGFDQGQFLLLHFNHRGAGFDGAVHSLARFNIAN